MVTRTISPDADQFLAAHQVSENKFELAGLRTASVRDQMMRAHLVVSRLKQRGYINEEFPLLVAGGGVAGVVAALSASRAGIDVVLIEKANGPLRTQMKADVRRLDPSEYDWPQPHWSSERPLWKTGDLPLEYTTDQAHILAQDWETVFFDWIDNQNAGANPAGYGSINYLFGVDARRLSIDERRSPAQGVLLTDSVNGTQQVFGAAISCIGFAGEKVSAKSKGKKDFQGFEFWGHDHLDLKHLGFPEDMTSPIKVCVSGGGDGAQQDIQRALTGSFGKELFQRIEDALPDLNVIRALLAEDAARRAFTWRSAGQALPTALRKWNAEYWLVVRQIWNSWSAKDRGEIADALLRPNVHVTWIVGGEVPDFAFGLNRLLTLLLLRLHALQSKRPLMARRQKSGHFMPPSNEVMIRKYWLDKVSGVDHYSSTAKRGATLHECGDPDACLTIPHIVEVSSATAKPTKHSLGPFDLVLIRHGVEQAPLFGWPKIREQIVPFDLPR